MTPFTKNLLVYVLSWVVLTYFFGGAVIGLGIGGFLIAAVLWIISYNIHHIEGAQAAMWAGVTAALSTGWVIASLGYIYLFSNSQGFR